MMTTLFSTRTQQILFALLLALAILAALLTFARPTVQAEQSVLPAQQAAEQAERPLQTSPEFIRQVNDTRGGAWLLYYGQDQ